MNREDIEAEVTWAHWNAVHNSDSFHRAEFREFADRIFRDEA